MKLKYDNQDGSLNLTFGDKNQHLAHTINDWQQLFGKWNWISFHLIEIYLERDFFVDGWEFEFVFLGLGFRIRWNKDSELLAELEKQSNETIINQERTTMDENSQTQAQVPTPEPEAPKAPATEPEETLVEDK